MLETVHAFDRRVDALFVRPRKTSFANSVFHWASQLADHAILWLAIALVHFVVAGSLREQMVRLVAAIAVESVLVNQILKRLIHRDRPKLLDAMNNRTRRPTTRSFPSGHSSSAATATLLLSLAVPFAAPIWIVFGTVVSLSRIHNRMHFASDVIAGAAIGLGLAAAFIVGWPVEYGR